ncbi:MAG TPA: hypothetical protein VM759_08900, partial [Longimicrobium sp.]|nr:hypothetical protein [Longimicrobium sp.]
LWPLELTVGALHTIRRLTVTTTFADEVAADTVEVGAAPVEGAEGEVEWQLFRPTAHGGAGDAAAYDGLLLLPTLASPVDGEVVEEVRYLRDETANLAWAVEATVRGEDGLPLDRHTAGAAAGTLPSAAQEDGAGGDTGPLRWRFQTEVPPHWFPLAPDAAGLPLFRRLMMRRVDEEGEVRTVRPAGEILAPEGQWIFREEVPRDGARVIRRHRMARGTDGRLYAWSARRAETGRGEGSSGLRYDDTLPLAPESQP